MPLQFYSANKLGTGGALSVNFNSKDQSVFLSIIKQVNWDEKTKKGSFRGGKTLKFKLSLDEVGGLINTIKTTENYKYFCIINVSWN